MAEREAAEAGEDAGTAMLGDAFLAPRDAPDVARELQEVRAAALAAGTRQRFLVEASGLLAGSLDYDETLSRIVRLAVPAFADWAAFNVVDGEFVRTVAIEHVDPAMQRLAAELEARYPMRADTDGGVARVIATGIPELIPEVSEELLRAVAYDDEHFRILRGVGFRSLINVPLVARGRVLGALGFATGESGRTFDQADLEFAEELGRRAALALDNALHFAAEHAARARAELVVDRLGRLQRTAARLSAALDVATTARVAVEEARAALGADAAYVVRSDADTRMLEMLHADGYPERLADDYGRFPLRERVPSADVVRDGQPLWLDTATESLARYAHLVGSPIGGMFNASATLPLVLAGTPVGALGLHWRERRGFDGDDRAFASTLAEQVALALERARLYEAERDARAIAERLQGVTAALSEAATPEQVTQIVMRQGIEALGAHSGFIAVIDEPSRTLRIIEFAGYDPALIAAHRTMPLDRRTPITDAARTGEPIWILSPQELESLYPLMTRADPRSLAWAALPLRVEGRTIGSIGLSFGEPRRFPTVERGFMTSLARQCAQALQRAELYREAQQANAAKSQFLAVMSHELRTPLNAIGGYADLLVMGVRGELTDAQRQDIERIRRSQQHLLGLINDVLNFARIEGGHVHYRDELVAVDGVLDAVLTLVTPQARAKALALDVDACDRSLVAMGDGEKVQQVLLNLLSNAIKFTPPGGRITVGCTRDGDAIAISVADTGIGIPPDRLHSVFDPFVQVHAGLTREHEGTGLGLSISRDLARGMRGELRVESVEGRGSTFTLTLRVA